MGAPPAWARRRSGRAGAHGRAGRCAKNDEGPIHLGYRLGHLKGDPQIYRAVVYDKGAYVLHMLRGIVGADAFRRACARSRAATASARRAPTTCARRWRRPPAATSAPYFQEWVYGTELPRLSVRSQAPSGSPPYRAAVEIAAEGLPGPVPLTLEIQHAQGREKRAVTLEPAGGRFELPAPAPIRRVDVNDDRGLLVRIQRR